MTTTATASPTAGQLTGGRCTDDESHRKATNFLTELCGSVPHDLCWDPTHPLQGHVHIGERELVVIAPRDGAHQTVVLTVESWGEVRRVRPTARRRLLQRLSISSTATLMTQLAG